MRSTQNKVRFSSYFSPKSWEKHKGKIIYEWIGIKWYKKYLPTTGDVVRRWNKSKQIDLSKDGRLEALCKYERKTRQYEWRHIFGAIIFVIIAALFDREFTLAEWILLPLLNLYINIYPILLQRYNRIRIIDILEEYGYDHPYKISA